MVDPVVSPVPLILDRNNNILITATGMQQKGKEKKYSNNPIRKIL
jgi:hypothetical protein